MQAHYTALCTTARHGRDRLIKVLLSVETYEPVHLDYLHKCALFDHSASFALLFHFTGTQLDEQYEKAYQISVK